MAFIEIAIVVLILIIVVTILIYAILSGLLEPVLVKTIEKYTCKGYFLYKTHCGDYSEAGPHFTETNSINPNLQKLAIYYDDPKRVPVDKCRYAVGAFLAYDAETSDREKIFAEFRSHGYEIKEMKDTDKAVYCTFPHATELSCVLGVARVYPQMSAYILERRLDVHLFMEHYKEGQIHFLAPLERHEDYCVSGIVLHAITDPISPDPASENLPPELREVPKDGVFPLTTLDELREECTTKEDNDSSSASSFEEVTRDDCSTSYVSSRFVSQET